MPDSIEPCLMFVGAQYGRAEEAIRRYVGLFRDGTILSLDLYGPGENEREGTVRQAAFVLNGNRFRALDSGHGHDFTFTPAISLFVTCLDESELDHLARGLSDRGEFLMEPANYGFSRKFAWVRDEFGVTWQLNLP
jgi:predicted 3-demethylubiquinone-9 3-methyltransferase (glyoxalase superfamily)